MSSSGPDHRTATRPIQRLRVVPNPTAVTRTMVSGVTSAGPHRPLGPVRTTGGRHRKPEPEDTPDAEPDQSATTDVVPAQRIARLTVPPPA